MSLLLLYHGSSAPAAPNMQAIITASDTRTNTLTPSDSRPNMITPSEQATTITVSDQ